jgi:putative ABC transport system permease protein
MRQLWRKLMALRRRDDLARRIREEMEFHAGMTAAEPGQSMAAARRLVGNSARIVEAADEVWSLRRLENLCADLRYGARALAKSPAFFLLAAAGTALGVSAITSVWSVAGTVLLRPMPYRDSSRLVVVSDQLLKLGFTRFPLSIANYRDYRAQNRVFDDIAAFQPVMLTVAGTDRAERVQGMLASSNLLPLLGAPLAQGRWFTAEENHGGRTDLAVISYDFWRTHQGRFLRIEDRPFEVIGVLQEGFSFRIGGEAPGVWLPVQLNATSRDVGNLQAIARLRSGVTAVQAQAAMSAMAAELKRRYRTGMGPHGEDGGYQIAVVPLREELYGDARPTLYALAGASAILLLLGLGNTAILWLGRAAARRSEAAVRLALGASRWRVTQQLAMEALLPSLAGGLTALAITLGALHLLNAAPPGELAAAGRFHIDLPVLAFAIALSAIAGMLSGALPLGRLLLAGIQGGAFNGGRGGIAERSESLARPLLVALEVGLACALLAPALLLAKSLTRLERVDPGFRTANLHTAWVSLPRGRYSTPAAIAGYYQRLQDQLAAWRGAANVTVASRLPLSFGEGGDPFSIEGRAYGSSGSMPQFAHQIAVGPNYFSLLHVPLRSGRDFEVRDFGEAASVAIVNETLARAFFAGEQAVGKRILMGAPRPGAPWLEIVGVVADVHTGELSRPPLPQIYQPAGLASPQRTMALIAAGPEFDWERAVGAVDPAVPAYAPQTMQQHVAVSLSRPRLRTQLFSAYGLLAFALAAFGIYSMAAYAAIRRRREFALRAALGASARQLLNALLADALWPASIGAAAGLAAAYAIARGLAATLYATGTGDAGIYATALLLALAAAGLSAAWGGRSAISAHPAEVLREE